MRLHDRAADDLCFIRELKGRNVYKVTVVIYLAVIGIPISLVLAWAFEVTPEGVRRTAGAESEEATYGTRAAYKFLIGVGLLGAAVAVGWYLTGGGASGPVYLMRAPAPSEIGIPAIVR